MQEIYKKMFKQIFQKAYHIYLTEGKEGLLKFLPFLSEEEINMLIAKFEKIRAKKKIPNREESNKNLQNLIAIIDSTLPKAMTVMVYVNNYNV